jgi:hypothetical protein
MSNLYGGFVSDTDESLKGKSGVNFGLNAGNVFLTKFAYNENVAKQGEEPREAIEVIVKVGDREFRDWINPITKVFKGNVEITDRNSDEFAAGFKTAANEMGGLITHYLKAVGVSEEAIKATASNQFNSFGQYASAMCALLPMGFDKRPLDVFLEYQWKFGTKKDGGLEDKTYPTLPKNLKGGYFIIPAINGVFKEVRTEDGGLKYVNQSGAEHPFFRDKNFMEGNKGTQQFAGNSSATTANPMAGAMTPNAAQSTTWAQPAQ